MMATNAATNIVPASDLDLATGITSPPDSHTMAPKDDASESELSDVEDPEEDIGDITPAYYADDGRVPVFKPTLDQFKSFKLYMEKINKYGMRSGIVKVIPPPEWSAELPRLDEAIKTIKVKEPIKQDIMGTSGTYRQANILHQRSYNLPQWRQLCDQSEHQPPAKRGERRANHDKPSRSAPRGTPKPKPAGAPSTKSKKRGSVGKPKAGSPELEIGGTPDRLPTPVSPSMKTDDDGAPIKQEDDEEMSPMRSVHAGRGGKAISVSSRRKYNRREAAARVDEAAFKDFKYELEGEDYSSERCEELERAYWKTLTYAPPLYGADMPGSLFTEKTKSWNLGKLENILDVLGTKIPGVNTAYLYLGMWKATFAWHLEDVDLYSINFLHFGAPKQWYSISQGDARRFEAAMKSIWPVDAKACDQFLRHKTFLISPSHLLQNFNIRVNKITHHPGEFVITFPYGYHSGYNLGYNCAEAVNFALDSWLEYGRVAKKCDCDQAQDSVWIDVHEIERKLRGEETEFEETEDEDVDEAPAMDLPTPPESCGDTKTKAPKRKRKRTANDKAGESNTKRIRIRVKAPAKEPCILCPNDIPSEALLPTEDGQKAHRICAQYIPETSIESGNIDVVVDVKHIDKARLDLKCNYCRSRKGACFQCSQKKCTRAYHATCAAAAGVFVEQGEIPVFGEDGTEYKDWAIEFSCRFHRSKRDKKVDGDVLDGDGHIRKAAVDLKTGDVCQMQYLRGDIFAGTIVENRHSEETLLLNILPRGELLEVEYKWLIIPEAADFHLPKPSANAIPLPVSRKAKQELNTSKRLADDLPRADDTFLDGFTWAEFKNEKIERNPSQVKIDFNKDYQIWYYLGSTSTEAKAQFTEDPKMPRHNPKGHFLDTIPKPLPLSRQLFGIGHSPKPKKSSSLTSTPTSQPYFLNSDRPYMYRPKDGSEPYQIDPQAYHSQQQFLNQATPQKIGSESRWLSSGLVTSSSLIGAASSVSSRNTVITTPQSQQVSASQGAPARTSLFSTSFSNKSQNSRLDLFAKYQYLQKEHNKSPAEYRSPYRPGGGFMNGYQGSLEKHLQQTLFKDSRKFSSSYPLMPYSMGQTKPHTTSVSNAVSMDVPGQPSLNTPSRNFGYRPEQPLVSTINSQNPSPMQTSTGFAQTPRVSHYSSQVPTQTPHFLVPLPNALSAKTYSVDPSTDGFGSTQEAISVLQQPVLTPDNIPDVPADSSSIIERMMLNLKKASSTATDSSL